MLVSLTAEPRNEFGKGAARRTRRSGRVPAVVYGTNLAPIHVSLPEHELMLALKKPLVTLEIAIDSKTFITAPRQIQRDPVRRTIEHVDLVILEATEAKERLARATVATAEAAAEAEAAAAPVRGGGESEFDHEQAVEAAHAAEAEAAAAADEA